MPTESSVPGGLLDGVQYVASGLTGFFLGALLDRFGWGAWTTMIMPFSVVGGCLMLALWNATPRNTKVSLKPAEEAQEPEPVPA